MSSLLQRCIFTAVLLVAATIVASTPALAADPPGDFSLQITPSPLVSSIKPGQTSELELKIRNAGSQPETLKIEPRSFRFDSKTQQLTLDDTTSPDIAQWVSFANPTFTVQPGQWYTQKIKVSLPKEAGFSYSFALIVSRKDAPKATEGGRLLKGSVAVFTLLNVDRPGAVRKLDVGNFTSTKRVYEYLPATFEIALKNTGNTIVQPYGNVFVQRNSSDKVPISTLSVNENKSYILPGTTRILKVQWKDGFPVNETTTKEDGSASQSLNWDWSGAKIADIRLGRYTAKLVGVYNDGLRDVPIVSEVSFWVIPWKILIALSVILGLIIWRAFVYQRTLKQARRLIEESQAKKASTKE